MAKNHTDAAASLIKAFNDQDWSAVGALFTDDAVYDEFGTQRRIEGKGKIVEAWQGWKQAMPDVAGTVNTNLASGDQVTLEIVWDGTHTGPLVTPGGTIPASGKRQRTPSAGVLTFAGDQVKQFDHYFDMMTLLQQIGAMPTG